MGSMDLEREGRGPDPLTLEDREGLQLTAGLVPARMAGELGAGYPAEDHPASVYVSLNAGMSLIRAAELYGSDEYQLTAWITPAEAKRLAGKLLNLAGAARAENRCVRVRTWGSILDADRALEAQTGESAQAFYLADRAGAVWTYRRRPLERAR